MKVNAISCWSIKRTKTYLNLFLVALTLTSTLTTESADAKQAARRPVRRAVPVKTEIVPYYGETFYKRMRAGDRDDSLKKMMFTILVAAHVKREGDFDAIVAKCPNNLSKNMECYGHKAIGYESARKVLMGQLHLESQGSKYYVHDVYCEKDYDRSDFPSGPFPAPNTAPNANILNTEHTWPQSRFTGRHPREVQKSDLHHLFPTDSTMNQIRGNFKFAEVDKVVKALPCPTAKFGRINGQNEFYFEPPEDHKGNVARALFYFSVRYQISIDPEEEEFLRRWNRQDPVDQEEVDRNEAIMEVQGNRNPFVDFPELADRITDF